MSNSDSEGKDYVPQQAHSSSESESESEPHNSNVLGQSQKTPATRLQNPVVRKEVLESKITLGDIPGSSRAGGAPTKLTTLAKSAIDWRVHVDNDLTKDELEANRKQGGGGYLEKVKFLDRVSERRENILNASKSGKRR
ncbi:bucentaur or craniofacial development-domain-containing protein [Rhodocollybia butyracea]|uniref:Bucentaur or craniofacial development-domain-containing protein n=1 Tax=Rhodocollybia butyracea TaxID=206335 RepID=A0A9P5PP54_9AGAR|nr:bucentaur or craniofacial development-domain-containing protein [Rhodocollybia butyracea]